MSFTVSWNSAQTSCPLSVVMVVANSSISSLSPSPALFRSFPIRVFPGVSFTLKAMMSFPSIFHNICIWFEDDLVWSLCTGVDFMPSSENTVRCWSFSAAQPSYHPTLIAYLFGKSRSFDWESCFHKMMPSLFLNGGYLALKFYSFFFFRVRVQASGVRRTDLLKTPAKTISHMKIIFSTELWMLEVWLGQRKNSHLCCSSCISSNGYNYITKKVF